jgi:hypothetical protein
MKTSKTSALAYGWKRGERRSQNKRRRERALAPLPLPPAALTRSGPLTEEEREFIVAAYPVMLVRDIACALERDQSNIVIWLMRMRKRGLVDPSTRRYNPHWTEQEEAYLYDAWGLVSEASICRNLDRTPVAVRLKAKRLGLTKKLNLFTARDVARVFRVDDKKVVRWIADGKLAARRAPFRQGRNLVWSISIEALEDFIKEWPAEFDPRDIDREQHAYFRNVAVQTRPAGLGSHVIRQYAAWEDRFIVDMFRHLPVEEIARRLNRPVSSVRARAVRLRKLGQPVGYRPGYRAGGRTPLWKPGEEEGEVHPEEQEQEQEQERAQAA